MVHCHLVAPHSDSIDATKYCVIDRSFENKNEFRILADWINRHKNDANSVTTGQPYSAAVDPGFVTIIGL